MKHYDLSILIPARNEMFVSNTVEDILKNKRGNTEVIVGLDGEWADPGIVDHPDVTILYVSESLGQRAMTNRLAQMSSAKYVAKCDAHVAVSEGFDVELMQAMEGHDDWTIVPVMRNFHVFDWVCEDGHRRYQGPSGPCEQCGKPTTRDIVWYAKPSPQSTAFCFDVTLHFQYFNQFKKRPEGQGDITETPSLQGSFFMLTREKYWDLNICDEAHGSWGQQGVEVALKTWLSGGKVMVCHKAWYAHMFRTQGGDFGFPYPNPGIDKARKFSRDLWLNNRFEKQIYPLSWLIDRFAPFTNEDPAHKYTHWHDAEGKEVLDQVNQAGEAFYKGTGPSKGIIYYTDNKLNLKIAHRVQKQLRSIGLPIVSASLKPMSFGDKNVVLNMKRGSMTMFKQILAALEASDADIIYFCEHDVLYHPSHFEHVPKDKEVFYYNQNFWRVKHGDPSGKAVHWDANQVSGLVCYREKAIKYYKARIEEIERTGFNRSFEPGGRNPKFYETFKSELPNIDIRHDGNWTKDKWSPNDFRDKSTCVNWQETTVDKISGWSNLLI